jgi:hypothetical protein
MTRNAIFRLILVGMTVAALQRLEAGSAVANDGLGHTIYSFGHPKAVAIQSALETARLHGWTDARIIAASDKTGYGAIAVAAYKGGRSVVGVSIGNGSQAEADTKAIENCLKAKGFDARVRWRFRG